MFYKNIAVQQIPVFHKILDKQSSYGDWHVSNKFKYNRLLIW